MFLERKGLTREEIEEALLRSVAVKRDSSHLGPAPRLAHNRIASLIRLVACFVPLQALLASAFGMVRVNAHRHI
jgi:hypothetical protein